MVVESTNSLFVEIILLDLFVFVEILYFVTLNRGTFQLFFRKYHFQI